MRLAHLALFALLAALPGVAAPDAGSPAARPAAPPPAPLPDWRAWAPLLGEWQADVPTPADPTGGFTLTRELGGRVLVRRNHAEYPATASRPAFEHRDLLVVSQEGPLTRAEYWDDEGHRIHYLAGGGADALVLVSEPAPGQPRFRFTYRLAAPEVLRIAFEIAPPGAPDAFRPYLEATAHRVR